MNYKLFAWAAILNAVVSALIYVSSSFLNNLITIPSWAIFIPSAFSIILLVGYLCLSIEFLSNFIKVISILLLVFNAYTLVNSIFRLVSPNNLVQMITLGINCLLLLLLGVSLFELKDISPKLVKSLGILFMLNAVLVAAIYAVSVFSVSLTVIMIITAIMSALGVAINILSTILFFRVSI